MAHIFNYIKVLLLWPFSLLYWLAVEMREVAYKKGLIRSHKATVPVISIGNIVAGGTGKTPMAIYVARMLMDKGLRTAVLSRGYKRKAKGRNQKINPLMISDGFSVLYPAEEAGDEPFLMASRLLGTKEKPGALVIIGRDRVAGAGKAVGLGAQVIILDDGFQHLRLKRDLDIVLLDSQRPYDNGWLLPVGMLREPKSVLQRAEAIVFTRSKSENSTLRHRSGQEFKNQKSKAIVFEARHKTGQLYGFADRHAPDLGMLRDSRILLFSGIARPESFEQSVRQTGLSYGTHLIYPDHNHYSQSQLNQIAGKAEKFDFLLTTEKDAVRLPSDVDLSKPLFVLPVEIEFLDEGQKQKFEQMVLDKVEIR